MKRALASALVLLLSSFVFLCAQYPVSSTVVGGAGASYPGVSTDGANGLTIQGGITYGTTIQTTSTDASRSDLKEGDPLDADPSAPNTHRFGINSANHLPAYRYSGSVYYIPGISTADTGLVYVTNGVPSVTAAANRYLCVQTSEQAGDTITAAGAFASSSCTIPANTLAVGEVFEVDVGGLATNNNGSAQTVSYLLKAGASTLVTGGTANMSATPNADRPWKYRFQVVVRAIGASGVLMAGGSGVIGISGTASPASVTEGTLTVDTTQNIVLTVEEGTALTSASIVMKRFTVTTPTL